jgi:hypothetical protein
MARYVTDSNGEAVLNEKAFAAKPKPAKDFPALYLLGTKVHLTE